MSMTRFVRFTQIHTHARSIDPTCRYSDTRTVNALSPGHRGNYESGLERAAWAGKAEREDRGSWPGAGHPGAGEEQPFLPVRLHPLQLIQPVRFPEPPQPYQPPSASPSTARPLVPPLQRPRGLLQAHRLAPHGSDAAPTRPTPQTAHSPQSQPSAFPAAPECASGPRRRQIGNYVSQWVQPKETGFKTWRLLEERKQG